MAAGTGDTASKYVARRETPLYIPENCETPIAASIRMRCHGGTAILSDRNGILPRWVGYLNLWVALLFTPDVLAFFFHSGPFAWHGIFIFWLAFVAYAVFLIAMGLVLRQAVKDSSDTASAEPAGSQ